MQTIVHLNKIIYIWVKQIDMKVAEIKSELHQTIDGANSDQLKQIYGLITNYLTETTEEWDAFTEIQKAHVLKGLEQADVG